VLSFSNKYLTYKEIIVTPTDNDYDNDRDHGGDDRSGSANLSQSQFTFSQQDLVALKMRGLPYSVQDQDIKLFFRSYKLLSDSIKLGKNDEDRLTG